MSNSILLFFFLSLFFISSTSSSSSSVNTTHKCSVQQTHALLMFKQNLSSVNDTGYHCSGDNPVMINWNTSTDCCHWNGVTCDHSTGDVIGLDLSCGMLQGTIHPNTTLFHLPRLQKLNLAFNDFTDSQLPPTMGRLSNSLTHLNISFCWFTGQVPTDISHLHKLLSLDLSMNIINFEPHVFINLLQNLTMMKELSLKGVQISSVLPANLNISSSLKLLNLQLTGLQGNLPHTIFNLQSLEKLALSHNGLTGHIPSEISLLPKLVELDLSWSGNMLIQPHIFSILLMNSTFLRVLRLSGVNTSFVLPTYLNISSSLRSLVLEFTGLQGKLPDNIFNLKYLEDLDLSGNNNLPVPFPKINISTNAPLYSLRLSYSGLNGSLPKSLGNLKYLEHLDVSNNMLSGTLPSSLFTLPSLQDIRLSNNKFQGNLPLELFSLQSLKRLSVANNQLTGQIDVLDNGPDPQTFRQLTNLTEIDLSYNSFRGDWELDALLSSLTNLDTLILSHSGISATTSNANHYVNPEFEVLSLGSCSLKVFPVSFRAMTNLIHLDLSNNDIQGHIPDSIRAMTDLMHLDLSNNDIQGHIPDWIGEIGRNWLSILDLSNNSITGTIPNVYQEVPISLYKCQKLIIIDLGNNKLNDTFPGWLGDLPKLQGLFLRSNSFHGGIVTSSKLKFPFPSLQVLDLSHNGFVGHLPTKYLQNLNAKKNVVRNNTEPDYVSGYDDSTYYFTITIVVKGVDQYFLRLLVDYVIVDLSDNKFEGEIPNILGYLKSLKALNLSHNSLTGRIPNALGKLSEIESLDLSWNNLTGEIPQSLADLTFLEILNLSHNHLVGRIPQGKQFNTFDGSSFGGNLKLCGLPLPKKCSESLEEQQLEADGYEEEEHGFTWKVVMMGYGCGALLGIVLGYLMLSTGRPKWFNEIADAAEHMILNRQNKRR
ncbi:putative leucine-rich repeat-containing, plant-type, leucine-rich repeat domain superfamily [Helianthus annuus]|nr:putative leucine-rich repeat-containing, plant-type, leucine-rich repeat domain superfamily [Helianthus annuus]